MRLSPEVSVQEKGQLHSVSTEMPPSIRPAKLI
jgi:hypothetical protein